MYRTTVDDDWVVPDLWYSCIALPRTHLNSVKLAR